jgi:EAL domain-containing protein (putative c-di-GMP-specific phosphodiesterase class I)
VRNALEDVAKLTSPRSRRPVPLVPAEELERGIARQELLLHYQPQLNLHTCQLEGAEALVRWQHPERGLLMPDSFISLAETSGLIGPLTDWVFNQAIRQAALWRRSGLDIGVSVNLSAQTLRQLDLPDRIAEATAAAGLSPSRITLEITESKVTDDVDSLLDITTRLRLKGFLLAIDDFGTGFSSLTQLRRLPFTELKLDRTFVSGAATDGDARSLLESSVNLAKRLQLKTVAEGIETEEEWNLLVWMGVDLGQGYYMARPMPAETLLPWHAGWQTQVA